MHGESLSIGRHARLGVLTAREWKAVIGPIGTKQRDPAE
jgi:hypothetical protein